MPPWSMWWRGGDTIAGFAPEARDTCARARTLPTRLNGQPAVACYGEDADTGRHLPLAIDVLTLDRDGLISDVTAFIDTETVRRFGVPDELL